MKQELVAQSYQTHTLLKSDSGVNPNPIQIKPFDQNLTIITLLGITCLYVLFKHRWLLIKKIISLF